MESSSVPIVEIDGASIDSRGIRPGQLFVPIVAERDGHDFIPGALAAGATAYLTAQAGDQGRSGRRRRSRSPTPRWPWPTWAALPAPG